MATAAIGKENFVLHKLHSLTGIVPIGFYMLQHLVLNTFSLAGPGQFNKVIGFFESMPKHILLGMEVLVLWIPILFHAVYGMFIVGRAMPNVANAFYKYRENRFYTTQRWTGILIFFFLIFHVFSTTVQKMITNNAASIEYAGMQQKLMMGGYAVFVIYLIGIACAAYHLSYGLWGFCIRWGISVSEAAQARMWKVSQAAFVAILVLGWAALAGFLIHKPGTGVSHEDDDDQPHVMRVVKDLAV